MGDLTARGDIRVDGSVRGSVTSSRRVVIGPGGRVEGAIRARELVVAGEVRGEVNVAHRLHVLKGGRFLAEAAAGLILIEEGAECEGIVRLRSLRPDGTVEEVVCRLPATPSGDVRERITASAPARTQT